MELFLSFIIVILILLTYYVTSFFFMQKKWCVRNYKSIVVPYSIGTVFIILLTIDFAFFNKLINTTAEFIYIFAIWGLGIIDDIYGAPYPKGIKGHFGYFFRKGIITTGFIKAIGVVIASLTYFQLTSIELVNAYVVVLLVLFPHTMNLLDTKPLRVLKSSMLFLIPLVLLGFHLSMLFFLIVITFWAFFESKMIAMLGDNGAMLTGAVIALNVIHFNHIFTTTTAVIFTVVVTFLAERISIQAWVEKTPIIKMFDQIGRVE
ncbi:hypothetical protein [Evansella cellulosilytica]|uniref:Uncharacterized protein n=1 Tax=Evansella cellulosilytica (strain ATCC 21833 / DSM 2522 / FERM P-1141 / JCM 9156 / N-4) TaxID=649639 RepID=E6TXR4_EVAC2|nr:hypothetical protein [Evansella cellulosilytica]ADU29990.1 hypothetical protein Bcell_1727 [Evansella cellulosilytica DSM 2522]